MNAEETVKLHIIIQINIEDPDADTGVTIAEWNALSNRERSDISNQMWEDAKIDNGGMWVVTDGAVPV